MARTPSPSNVVPISPPAHPRLRPREEREGASSRTFATCAEAARRLGIDEDALRARARRAARIEDGRLVADLGIVRCVKFGAHWRFVFLDE